MFKRGLQFSAILSGALLAAAPVTGFAAGNYSETFDDNQAQGWSAIGGSWVAANGYYANSVDQVSATIATYGGDTWNTGFTYKARLYSDYPASGNKVGVVFGYQDADSYYEVMFNMLGLVTLTRVNNGAEILLASGSVSGLAADRWFDVEVTLSGSSATVRANGAAVLSGVALPSLVTGRIGLNSRWNKGRFDSVSVTMSSASTAKLLFKTGFENGVSLGAPMDCFDAGCWQDLKGTDSTTGFTFPVRLWGGAKYISRIQLDVGEPTIVSGITTANVGNYMRNDIVTTVGHTGQNTRALYQQLFKQYNSDRSSRVQNMFQIFPGATNQGDLYYSFWLKTNPNLASLGRGGWKAITQVKTSGDFRAGLQIQGYDSSRPPYYAVQLDNYANGGLPVEVFDVIENYAVPIMPGGTWVRVEAFYRMHPTSGRAWFAVNGKTIVDHRGKMMGINKRPINRVFAFPLYTNYAMPAWQYVDDFEMWDGFPPHASAH